MTASPWFVCTEIDECCANCYSREFTKQKFAFNTDHGVGFIRRAYQKAGFKDWDTMPVWGDKAPRVKSRGFWNDVYKWDRRAAAAEQARCRELSDAGVDEPYERPRIFTSLIDFLDPMPAGIIDLEGNQLDPVKVFAEFLQVIRACDALDWLLLTKRVEQFSPLMHAAIKVLNDGTDEWISAWLDGDAPEHVWFGYTAGTQKSWLKRSMQASQVPTKVLWCSAEPLLEELHFNANGPALGWIVIGGESGKKRRDCGVETICNLALEAKANGVRVYVKQDCAELPGQRGRIPDDIWALKEYPV